MLSIKSRTGVIYIFPVMFLSKLFFQKSPVLSPPPQKEHNTLDLEQVLLACLPTLVTTT